MYLLALWIVKKKLFSPHSPQTASSPQAGTLPATFPLVSACSVAGSLLVLISFKPLNCFTGPCYSPYFSFMKLKLWDFYHLPKITTKTTIWIQVSSVLKPMAVPWNALHFLIQIYYVFYAHTIPSRELVANKIYLNEWGQMSNVPVAFEWKEVWLPSFLSFALHLPLFHQFPFC